MEKDRKILLNFTTYILLFLFICLIGLSNVFASEVYEDLGNLNNNTTFYVIYNGSASPVSMPIGQEWNFESYDIDSFIINIDNYVFKKNNNYQLTLTLPKSIITNANAYTVVDGNGNSCSTGLIKDMLTNYPKFTFSCGVDTNSISLNIFNNNGSAIITNRWWFSWTNVKLDRLISSEEELNNTIKNELSTCRDGYNLLQYTTTQNTTLNGLTFIFNEDRSITVNGTANDVTVFEFIKDASIYLNGGMYTFSGSTGGSRSTYFMEAVVGPDNTYFHSINGSETLSLVDGSYLFRAYIFIANGATLNNVTFKPMFEKGTTAHKYEPYSADKICTNKIDQTNDKLDETNDKLNDLNQSLTDSSPTDMSGLSDSAGWLPAGPVDSILTLPLTMLNSLVNNLTSNSCQTLNIELPFVKENLTLPCVKSLYDKMGVTGSLFTTAGLIASAFILFNYLLNLYQWVDSTLTMRENTMPGYFDDNWGGGA